MTAPCLPGRCVALTLRITIADSNPAIWRTIQVSHESSLHELHRTIQLIFSWADCHLYEFHIGNAAYQAPGEYAEALSSIEARLGSLGLRARDRFEYVYDFGDDWLHEIVVEEVVPTAFEEALPWLVDGERRGPPEDSGGMSHYRHLLQLRGAVAGGKRASAGELESLEWLGESFDPDDFSVAATRHALELVSGWDALKG